MTDFGSSFKKAREALGVPLDKIAAETRISTRFLRAIENEEFQLLPGGIFNRGFIRAYAQRVGLDPEQALADYERISSTTPQPVDAVRTSSAKVFKSDNALYFLAVGGLVLLIVIFYFANRTSGTGSAPTTAPATETLPTAQAPAPAAPVTPPAATILPEVSAPATAAAASAPIADSPLMLELDATGETWIRLSADGIVVDDTILQPGASKRYTAKNSIDITIGNAAGVTMKVNGRNVGALGAEGRTRKFSITPENAANIRS